MLARNLGRTLDELAHTMSAEEFDDHWHDYQSNPWGELRADYHAAMISRTVADYAGKSRSTNKPAQLKEFMLNFSGEQDDDEPDIDELIKQRNK